MRFTSQRPRRGRLQPPWLRARSQAKRQRNPILRALGDADQAVLRALRTRGHEAPVEAAMRAFGTIGEFGAVWIAIGLGGVAADPSRRRRWAVAATVAPVAVNLNYAAKVAIGRGRPLIEGHPPLAKAPSKLSFPSAHSTSSLAGATALARVEPRARGPLYALAGAICVSRPYLGMHYPSDVLAGAALGIVIGALFPGVGDPGAEARLMDLADSTRRESPFPSPPGSNGDQPVAEGEPAGPATT